MLPYFELFPLLMLGINTFSVIEGTPGGSGYSDLSFNDSGDGRQESKKQQESANIFSSYEASAPLAPAAQSSYTPSAPLAPAVQSSYAPAASADQIRYPKIDDDNKNNNQVAQSSYPSSAPADPMNYPKIDGYNNNGIGYGNGYGSGSNTDLGYGKITGYGYGGIALGYGSGSAIGHGIGSSSSEHSQQHISQLITHNTSPYSSAELHASSGSSNIQPPYHQFSNLSVHSAPGIPNPAAPLYQPPATVPGHSPAANYAPSGSYPHSGYQTTHSSMQGSNQQQQNVAQNALLVFEQNGKDQQLKFDYNNFYPFSKEQLNDGWTQAKVQKQIANMDRNLRSKLERWEKTLYAKDGPSNILKIKSYTEKFALIQRTEIYKETLRKALENPHDADSTDLIEVLVTMTNEEREMVIVPFLCGQLENRKLMIIDIQLKGLMAMLCKTNTKTVSGRTPSSEYNLINKGAKTLHDELFKKILKTNSDEVNRLLTFTSYSQLGQMFDALSNNFSVNMNHLNVNDQFLQMVKEIEKLTKMNVDDAVKALKEKELLTSFLCSNVLVHIELTNRYKNIMQALCRTKRDSSFIVDQEKAYQDAETIRQYLWNGDVNKPFVNKPVESVVRIFTKENYAQLRATFSAFESTVLMKYHYRDDIVECIRRKLESNRASHFLQVLEAIAMDVQFGRPHFLAMLITQKVQKLLNKNILTTDTDAHNDLKRILLGRAGVDLPYVIKAFGTVKAGRETITNLENALSWARAKSHFEEKKKNIETFIEIVRFAAQQTTPLKPLGTNYQIRK